MKINWKQRHFQTLDLIKLFVIIVFFISIVFDGAVTYTVFKYDRQSFHYELNTNIKAFLLEGELPILSILFNFLPLLTVYPFLYLYNRTLNKHFLVFYLANCVVLSIIAGEHFIGGLSWLLWKEYNGVIIICVKLIFSILYIRFNFYFNFYIPLGSTI